TGVGALIHIFSVGYMREDPSYPRYFAYLNLFVFFMLVLILGANYPVMFVGWEGVGLCSYLLIGYWFSEKANADAGKKAFIVNRIGDYGFLVAMFLLFANLGTLDFVPLRTAVAALAYGGARRNHRLEAIGHQEGARVLHGLAARLHVRRRGSGRVQCGNLPSRHARVLQGAVVPRLRLCDLRNASRVSRAAQSRGRAGHA